MSHADKVREAERALVECVVSRRRAEIAAKWPAQDEQTASLADNAITLRAATCPVCGGTWHVWDRNAEPEGWDELSLEQQVDRGLGAWGPCPAGCDNGRRK